MLLHIQGGHPHHRNSSACLVVGFASTIREAKKEKSYFSNICYMSLNDKKDTLYHVKRDLIIHEWISGGREKKLAVARPNVAVLTCDLYLPHISHHFTADMLAHAINFSSQAMSSTSYFIICIHLCHVLTLACRSLYLFICLSQKWDTALNLTGIKNK